MSARKVRRRASRNQCRRMSSPTPAPTGGKAGRRSSPAKSSSRVKLNTPLDKLARKHAGRRSLTKTERKHGRYIKARPAGEKRDDIAFDATIRAAAPYQRQRTEKRKTPGLRHRNLRLTAQDPRQARGKSGAIPGGCLVVDGRCRAHECDQRRHPLPAHGCLSAPRPGGFDRLPKRPCHAGVASHQLRTTGPARPDGYSRRRKDPALRRLVPRRRCIAAGEDYITPISNRC